MSEIFPPVSKLEREKRNGQENWSFQEGRFLVQAEQQQKSNAPPEASSPALQSEEEQQRLLDIFSNAFNKTLSSDEFTTTLQEIKQALFNREFATAFGREDYLEAYAARWSPTRALCYATVLLSIKRHLNKILIPDKETPGKESDLGQTKGETTSNENDKLEQDVAAGIESIKLDSTSPSRNASLHMLSVGGCAAEHIAFASYIQATSTYGHLTLLDSGPWAQVVSLLESSTVNPHQSQSMLLQLVKQPTVRC
ncbi:hypothetical protein SNK05_013629 [Fusarium graminearum]